MTLHEVRSMYMPSRGYSTASEAVSTREFGTHTGCLGKGMGKGKGKGVPEGDRLEMCGHSPFDLRVSRCH